MEWKESMDPVRQRCLCIVSKSEIYSQLLSTIPRLFSLFPLLVLQVTSHGLVGITTIACVFYFGGLN